MAVHVTRAGVALTVGIIVVTGLIIGGLFWVKNSGEQARRDDALKVAEQQLKDQDKNGVALNSGDKNSGSNSNSSSSNSTNSSNGSNGSNSTSSGSTNQGGSTTSTSSSQSATELPKTGPAENSLLTLMALGLVTFAGVSYWRSRRLLLEA